MWHTRCARKIKKLHKRVRREQNKTFDKKKQEYKLQLYDKRETSRKSKIEDMEIMIDRINQDSKQLINSQSKTTVAKWYHITTKEERNEIPQNHELR